MTEQDVRAILDKLEKIRDARQARLDELNQRNRKMVPLLEENETSPADDLQIDKELFPTQHQEASQLQDEILALNNKINARIKKITPSSQHTPKPEVSDNPNTSPPNSGFGIKSFMSSAANATKKARTQAAKIPNLHVKEKAASMISSATKTVQEGTSKLSNRDKNSADVITDLESKIAQMKDLSENLKNSTLPLGYLERKYADAMDIPDNAQLTNFTDERAKEDTFRENLKLLGESFITKLNETKKTDFELIVAHQNELLQALDSESLDLEDLKSKHAEVTREIESASKLIPIPGYSFDPEEKMGQITEKLMQALIRENERILTSLNTDSPNLENLKQQFAKTAFDVSSLPKSNLKDEPELNPSDESKLSLSDQYECLGARIDNDIFLLEQKQLQAEKVLRAKAARIATQEKIVKEITKQIVKPRKQFLKALQGLTDPMQLDTLKDPRDAHITKVFFASTKSPQVYKDAVTELDRQINEKIDALKQQQVPIIEEQQAAEAIRARKETINLFVQPRQNFLATLTSTENPADAEALSNPIVMQDKIQWLTPEEDKQITQLDHEIYDIQLQKRLAYRKTFLKNIEHALSNEESNQDIHDKRRPKHSEELGGETYQAVLKAEITALDQAIDVKLYTLRKPKHDEDLRKQKQAIDHETLEIKTNTTKLQAIDSDRISENRGAFTLSETEERKKLRKIIATSEYSRSKLKPKHTEYLSELSKQVSAQERYLADLNAYPNNIYLLHMLPPDNLLSTHKPNTPFSSTQATMYNDLIKQYERLNKAIHAKRLEQHDTPRVKNGGEILQIEGFQGRMNQKLDIFMKKLPQGSTEVQTLKNKLNEYIEQYSDHLKGEPSQVNYDFKTFKMDCINIMQDKILTLYEEAIQTPPEPNQDKTESFFIWLLKCIGLLSRPKNVAEHQAPPDKTSDEELRINAFKEFKEEVYDTLASQKTTPKTKDDDQENTPPNPDSSTPSKT